MTTVPASYQTCCDLKFYTLLVFTFLHYCISDTVGVGVTRAHLAFYTKQPATSIHPHSALRIRFKEILCEVYTQNNIV